ncbi:MAG TPA: outer membrane insertion C- signal [Candidatus Kapabacteria bacterium]
MKKLILLLLVMSFASSIRAQEIGVRIGDVVGHRAAIDAVFNTEGPARIHADLSFGNGGVGIEVLWDIVYRQIGNSDFDWYLGVGPTALFHNDAHVGLSGEIGVEAHFVDAPIAIGVDWRPTMYVIQSTDFDPSGFGLNIRFVF